MGTEIRQPVKLNLGCGEHLLPGYINLDAKFGDTVWPIWRRKGDETYGEGIDEIRASHVLEHFPHGQVLNIVKGWASKLRPGGVLKIAVPDFHKIAEDYLANRPSMTQGYTMGGQLDEHDFHRAIFDEGYLRELLKQAGLVDIKPWTSEIRDCASLPVSLNLMGRKPEAETFAQMNYRTVKAAQDGHGPAQTGGDATAAPEDLRPVWTVLKARQKNVYSQFGEDGAVAAIFEAIGAANRVCLEAGAGDGIFFSNTRQWVEQGWRAILIEKDPVLFGRLKGNATENCVLDNIEIGTEPPNSLDGVLARYGAPKDIDLLSLDIDGQDWHVFNAMLFHRPRVVVMEYAIEGDAERYFGPDFIPVRGGKGQAGRNAVVRLLCGKGYKPVAVSASNVIAVQGECMKELRAWADKELTAGPEPVPMIRTAALQETPAAEQASAGLPAKPKVIRAVMSMPRLAFSDNMFSAIRAFCIDLNINIEKGSGVFWDQVLTRMIESHLNDGTDYIFTVDYDTWFVKEHVIRLCQLMQEHPEIDALVPLQTKREEDLVLFAKFDDQGRAIDRVPVAELQQDVTPIVNGHFGLTIFRVKSMSRLKKPWFRGVPDPDGGWDEGRTDPDIYFWKNFYASGLKAYLAPNVKIVHLQLMGTVPGALEDNWKPRHCYITDLEKGKYPAGVVPKVEFIK